MITFPEGQGHPSWEPQLKRALSISVSYLVPNSVVISGKAQAFHSIIRKPGFRDGSFLQEAIKSFPALSPWL